jgi:hypothetical protein
MHEWDTFAVVVGGSAGALVGVLFVAISIHAGRIAESTDLRGRAAQTLVIFAALLLIGLLRSIPVQRDWVLGIELVVLAVFVAIALIALDRLAEQSDSSRPVARTLSAINPSTITAGGIALAGVLMLCRCQRGRSEPELILDDTEPDLRHVDRHLLADERVLGAGIHVAERPLESAALAD